MRMDRLDEKRLVCTQPFTWCEVHADGTVFGCCPSWLDAPMGNLLQQTFEEIWNGQAARQLRRSVLDGTFAQCRRLRCPRLSAVKPPVMFLREVASAALKELLSRNTVRLPFGPHTVNLCYDHRCNLSCPSCRKDYMPAGKRAERRLQQIEGRIRKYLWPHMEELIIGGFGDPFGSPSYRSLLRGLAGKDFPRLHTLRLHTNGLLWDRDMWATMPYAAELLKSAEISVDAATPATYAVNRRGGEFSRLLRNLAFIRTLGVPIKLSFVVQQNNYREMSDFVAMARNFGCEVYFSQLVNWGTYGDAEYIGRAVHDPKHFEHSAFLDILEPLADMDCVDIGNLRPLLPQRN